MTETKKFKRPKTRGALFYDGTYRI